VFSVKYSPLDAKSASILSRDIYLPKPVVTDQLIMTVVSSMDTTVFKMDIIGLPPDKKYTLDPMLSPNTYTDCKLC
jgi:hypothetical protein